MKNCSNSNNSSEHKRHDKSKYRTPRRPLRLFLILCCCLTVATLAIGLLSNDLLFTKDERHGILLSTNEATTPYSHRDPTTDTQTYYTLSPPDETQSIADEADWRLILVNRWNYIPDNYAVELTELANGEMVDKRIYPALQQMFDAARNDGVYPVVVSGYRTAEKQQSLMDEKIAEYKAMGYSTEKAKIKAEEWVALPGTSEHQLGIAVDINADGIHSAGYEVYDWLDKNAYKYGFICRYPPEKTDITGVMGESWHYRYVGIEDATEIYNQGVCLEEYLDRLD